VVGEVLVHDHLRGLADVLGIDAVELHRPGVLPLVERDHVHGHGVTLDQRPRRDHLAHVQPGPVPTAQLPERHVGDAGHGGQHDGRVDGERADLEGGWNGHAPQVTALTSRDLHRA
jgi:hypothetical protein